MSFSFKTIGHFLAAGLSDIVKGAQAVETFITKIDTPANQQLVESLTALIPDGAVAVNVERAVFAIAGEVAGVLSDFNAANAQKLIDAGLDKTVIDDFEALLKSIPSLFTSLKAAVPAS